MSAIPRCATRIGAAATINAQHGKTFFLATRLLAPQQRPAVHALYGFARRADDILDDFDSRCTDAERGSTGCSGWPPSCSIGWCEATQPMRTTTRRWRAVVHTARKYDIAWDLFDDFLGSMRMDLTVTDYPDRAALDRYMYGSAEVIGLQLLPVLGTICPREEAAPYAAALGKAFQLTNFLRDVDEDLATRPDLSARRRARRPRVDRDVLMWCHTNRRTDARVRRALVEQHAETTAHLRVCAGRVSRCLRRDRGLAWRPH